MLGGVARTAPSDGREQLRWRLADDDAGRPDLLGGAERHPGRGELAGLELLHVKAQRIINRVPAASRMPFRWTINPYRGCSHGCVYCFARPTHEYLGFDIGDDFDRRIVVKINAVERLRAELRAPSWAGEAIAMGTNTDPYQPAEGRYRLTRGIVEALTEARNPFSILTKSTLIARDVDLLAEARRHTDVQTALSIGCLDPDVWRATEPHTPSPRRRIETVARLNAAGVPCEVMIAPVLPGISDSDEQLEEVVAAAVDAGATVIAPIALHLRGPLRDHYLGWLGEERPELVADTTRRYRGAYAPAPERDALSARVRAMVAARGGGRRERGRWSWRGPDPAPEHEGDEEQLSLL
jgi:DNA repair photolyase